MSRLSLIFLHFSLGLLFLDSRGQQIANYVGNGSFEDDCVGAGNIPIYWPGLDSMVCVGGGLASECPGNGAAPLNGFTYQKARTGKGYMLSGFLNLPGSPRGPLKNRLKNTLKSGETYCARFFVNISNNSTYGMDGFGAYFGSKLLDTITKCPLEFYNIVPQIYNPSNNIITDTLNWTAIQGTFTAVGSECYMVIGNLKTNAATNKVLINPTNLPLVFTDVCVDDVSCVPIDLPADAGPDKRCIVGNSVYIGRPSDVGIDYACQWFMLPNMSTPIATVAGMWVSPVVTTTYVLRQQLWCSGVRWDTVVVYPDAVGIEKLKMLTEELRIYPVPASDFMSLQVSRKELFDGFSDLIIYNNLGESIREEEISFKENSFSLRISDLSEGVYLLQVRNKDQVSVNKRFVISR